MANLRKIKDLAKAHDISLDALASEAGITPQALSKIMRENTTKVSTLEQICRVLKVSPLEFFDGYVPPEPSVKVEQKLLSNSGQNAGRDIRNEAVCDNKSWLEELKAQRLLTEKAQAQADRMLAIIEKMQGI